MNVIIIGCHKGLTRGVIKSLINNQTKFSFIGTKDLKRSVSLSKLCKESFDIEEADLEIGSETIIEMIKRLIAEDDQNFVIPTGIRSTLYVSKYAKEVKGIKNYYPISDYETLSMLNNKWDFYLFLQKQNLPTPKTILFESFEQENMMFPCITKPLDSENSNQVMKSDNVSELVHAKSIATIPLLIQEYISGYDVNLCLFSLNGEIKAWTINQRTDLGIVFEHNQDILEIGRKIVSTLNYSGLIHFDLRFNEQEGSFLVLECNPRVWGSMLHSAYVGVNFMELAIHSQNNGVTFNEIETGAVSINKHSIIKKLLKPSFNKQDFKSILIQIKLVMLDPIYELNFFLKDK